jgi:hypothetical protein
MNCILGIGNDRSLVKVPRNCIFINTEQIYDSGYATTEIFRNYLKNNIYWDYSTSNEKLTNNPSYYQFGFCNKNEHLHEYLDDSHHNIDVLFIGSPSKERKAIEKALNSTKDKNGNPLVVKFVHDVYGKDKIQLMAKAKIVLNLHYYRYFEIVRVGYLLNNHRFVISEVSPNDDEWSDLHPGFVRCEYTQVVDTCLTYLADYASRKIIADRGYQLYQNRLADLPIADVF